MDARPLRRYMDGSSKFEGGPLFSISVLSSRLKYPRRIKAPSGKPLASYKNKIFRC